MRSWPWLVGGGVQLLLVVGSALPPISLALGVRTWHHNAAIAATLVFALVFRKRMTSDRAFLGLGVLVTTGLAILSAFLLLYLKQDLKDWGLKDWAKFWHVTWSWWALVFFLGHTWVNRHGLLRSLRRMHRGLARAASFSGTHVLILAAIPITWSSWGARTIVDGNYIVLTLWTWLLLAAPAYAAWALSTVRHRRGLRRGWSSRASLQAFTDSWLTSTTLLANLTGFPLLYFGTKDLAIKYVAKYWHTWPSIAMAILVFAHTIQFWDGVKRHARSDATARRPNGWDVP